MSHEALQTLFQYTPASRLAQARNEIGRYSPAAREELRAETDWLMSRHPGLDRRAAAFAAWVRLRAGMNRRNQPERDAEARAWVEQGLSRRNATLRFLADVEAEHGADAWPFRRLVEPGELCSLADWQARAFLDVVPRPLWTFANDEAAAWPDSAWSTWDANREKARRTHPWLEHPEDDALAWAFVTGDIRHGASRLLWFCAAWIAREARANRCPPSEVAVDVIARVDAVAAAQVA